jgi:signal transduction histidine kinase/ActR/RegA family two-component response regulator
VPSSDGDEAHKLVRAVVLQNANSILIARPRIEAELIKTTEQLERRTQELAHSLSMVRATLESTTDAILATDAHGTVTDFNEKFLELWRMPRSIIETRAHREVLEHIAAQFTDPEACRDRVESIYRASPPESSDILELADGRVLERFSKIQSLGQKNVGRVWSFRDVTTRRRTEDALRDESQGRAALLEAERKARAEVERVSLMKDEFLATLSHELRTPLTAVLGWSQILLTGQHDPADVQHGLATIAQNARAQAQLIEDLLDMSRIVSGKIRLDIQRTELASIIDAAVDAVKPSVDAKAIRLLKIIDPHAGSVFGDPNRLQQVVWNLLSNAVKFTPEGGRIHVLVTRVHSHLEITVRDSGPGISPEFLPQVFERFRQADASITRKHGGLGLGLAIVKQLVELHGGTVRVDNAPAGGGAIFVVSLPLGAARCDDGAPEPESTRRTPVLREAVDLAGTRIVVIDDEPDARDLVKWVLENAMAEVFVGTSAAEGLALIRNHRPDVLISDIGMPDRDGYQLIRDVRSLPAAAGGKTLAIALTAFARSEDRTRALLAGYQIHLAKPVEPQELVATVRSLLDRIDSLNAEPA